MQTALPPIHALPTAQIYCHICRSIEPLVVDDPQSGDRGPFDNATDLVCGTCQFVVATAYSLKPPREGSERPRAVDLRAAGENAEARAEAGCRETPSASPELQKHCA